ncbi:uncharacterized protein [Drosophila kikkawai]|uniref:Uncharacterized protein isoform X2 n=1 Tax=Drosophila kikkawai TaxID=30033 RepID=A0ABM4GP23_DROKI
MVKFKQKTMASYNPSRLWRAAISAAATVEVSRTDDVVLGYPAEGEPSPGKTGPQAGVLPEDIDWEAFSEALEHADEILAGRRPLPDLHRAVSHAGAAAAVPNRVPVARRRVVFASAVGTPRSPTPEENRHGRPNGSSDSNDVVATGPRSKGSDVGTADDDGSQEDDDVVPVARRHRRASSMSDFDAADVARRTIFSASGVICGLKPKPNPKRSASELPPDPWMVQYDKDCLAKARLARAEQGNRPTPVPIKGPPATPAAEEKEEYPTADQDWVLPPAHWRIRIAGGRIPRSVVERVQPQEAANRRVNRKFLFYAGPEEFRVHFSKANRITISQRTPK